MPLPWVKTWKPSLQIWRVEAPAIVDPRRAGTQIGQPMRVVRSGQHPAQLDHADAVQDFVFSVYDPDLAQTVPAGEAAMSESMERAHETIEEHAPHADPWARRVAMLVSLLAAVLAITDIGGKAAQNAYLTHHVALSNDWAFFQARNVRAVVRTAEADVLASLPTAADPAVQARIKDARDNAARMRDDPQGGDGMKQLDAKAKQEEVARDRAEHRYHSFEYAVGALEIAIVLASVSVITRMRQLTIAAAVIGAFAAAASLAVATNLF